MKAVNVTFSLGKRTEEAEENGSVAMPFKSGCGTLQLSALTVRCHASNKNKAKKSVTGKEDYVPHNKRTTVRKIVVSVNAHVKGPEDLQQRTYTIANAFLATSRLDNDDSRPTDFVSYTNTKLDLRFQMEHVRLSATVKRLGKAWDDFEVDGCVNLSGSISAIAE